MVRLSSFRNMTNSLKLIELFINHIMEQKLIKIDNKTLFPLRPIYQDIMCLKISETSGVGEGGRGSRCPSPRYKKVIFLSPQIK